eukprot:CAMPEP_0174936654 /NCGR_PEP_ID=MMETSP1355-20121228/58184_1 /TAXON_ID=464990 /ORGANISM="Hemiselmis tepida, Strain CCMP443" /LENGTH=181 /DNA_ID=CAMNT_0016183453 /DNA_START=18 /DNA_END=560 /DNA_ORIENTATION=+
MASVGLVSAALVREWLKRHGYANTLAQLETECPRGDDAISSRTELGKILGIEKQLRRNKEREKNADGGAFQSTLEVLSDYVIRSATARGDKAATGGDKAEGQHRPAHHRHHKADPKPSAHSPPGNNPPASPPTASSPADSKPSVSAFSVKAPPAQSPPSRNTGEGFFQEGVQSLEVEDLDE